MGVSVGLDEVVVSEVLVSKVLVSSRVLVEVKVCSAVVESVVDSMSDDKLDWVVSCASDDCDSVL